VASRRGTGPGTRRVLRRASSAAGLYGAEEPAGRSFPTPAKNTQANIRRTDRASFSDAGRVLDRVRVVARRQGAHSVESCDSARLDEPAAGLAGNREMIQITAQMRVLVAIERVDGRKGIDSLVRLCQEKLAEDPFSGCVFVFRSRSGTAIRLLSYDGQGYWLAQKRLSKGTFVWWPEGSGAAKALEAYEAQLLMAAGDVSRVRAAPMWRRVNVLK
jgi:transposase